MSYQERKSNHNFAIHAYNDTLGKKKIDGEYKLH